MANEHRPSGNGNTATLLTVVVVVAVLYFARVVFIPLALAVLVAFLLAPLAIRLRHWGLGRIPSALIVVLFSFLLVSVLATFMTSQMTDLARRLPEYQQNVRQKLNSIRSSGGGFLNRVTRFTSNFTQELVPSSPPNPRQSSEDKPVPVEIRRAPFSPLEIMQRIVGSLFNGLLTGAIVIVFVIFMLIEREDLRDRLIRLVGAGRVNVTTQALDDAAHRLSRYLLAQLVVNVAFGVAAGIGLYFIGVPNPLLWALLAILLRYIPYLGIWIAAILPAIIAFAVEPGWLKVPAIFGLYFGIDLLMYNFVEPYFYGTSTGISPVAILVAAVFWTWLWGPVGLLLATPLTVCVVVIGRYVPSMEWLSIVLSDAPVLSLETKFYQRMLAMDLEEATEVAETFIKEKKSFADLADAVIIPALTLAEQDRHHGHLDDRQQQFIFQNTRILVEDLTERADDLAAGNGSSRKEAKTKEADRPAPDNRNADAAVVLIPARDEADELASLMLQNLLEKAGVPSKLLSCASLAGECVNEVKQGQARIACVTVVPPFGYMHARYMCRRLRAEFPDLKVVAAVLTEKDVDEIRQRRPAILADELATTLKQSATIIVSLAAATHNGTTQDSLKAA